MWTDKKIKKILLARQVKPLFTSTILSGLSNIFAVALIYTLLDAPDYATLPFAGIVFFALARIFVARHYLASSENNLTAHLYIYLTLTLFMGTFWGVFEFTQYKVESIQLRNIVMLLNIALIAGSITTLYSSRGVYLAYILPQGIAIIGVFSLHSPDLIVYLNLAIIIFMGFMIASCFNMNRIHKKGIELTYNNEQLIGDLNKEIGVRESVQVELEHNKGELENKVNERTNELEMINFDLENVISEKEKAEESLQYLAYHDELTGLPNKNLLIDRISQSIKISARDRQQMAILFLDLDRFKSINDSLGHAIGDNLLKQVAFRINETLRKHDTVSRYGGDEFVMVLEKLKSYNEAIQVAKKVINGLIKPFEIDAHKIHIGASIGISVYPTDGDEPTILLRNADTAMYRGKKAGGNQLQFYDASMSNQLRDRIELENELHGALENNEFYIVYQPQVSAKTGITTGVESLIRWNNTKHGEIPPDRFVPLLEETGLIYSVGRWIVTEVIEFIRTHNYDITFSINLSALQCNNHEFIDFVEAQISKAKVDPKKIEFEITESLLINDFETTKSFLDNLHTLGCTIALDDFGTGYTSMNYISRLPIDVIKIDKSLIRNISENNNLRSIVSAIVTMSKSLGMKNVFEGIETEDELLEIQKLDGDIIQGYYYSKPLRGDDVEIWFCDKSVEKET
ncbi:MAG: EAL domain-containing protein [Proteobacteria bacterium]|nr:EAL domain-containing protein [Pseudomonadota bacterium]